MTESRRTSIGTTVVSGVSRRTHGSTDIASTEVGEWTSSLPVSLPSERGLGAPDKQSSVPSNNADLVNSMHYMETVPEKDMAFAFQEAKMQIASKHGVFNLGILSGILFCSSAPTFTEVFREDEQVLIVCTTLVLAVLSAAMSWLLRVHPKVVNHYDPCAFVIGLCCLLLAGLVQDHLARIAAIDDGHWDSQFVLDACMAIVVSGSLGTAAVAAQFRWWCTLLLIHVAIPINVAWALLAEERQEASIEVFSLVVVNAQFYVMALLFCCRQRSREQADRIALDDAIHEYILRQEEEQRRLANQAIQKERAIERLATEQLLDEFSRRHEDINVEFTAYPQRDDKVIVLKSGRLQGKTATVVDLLNDGMVKVLLDDKSVEEARLQHFMRTDLSVLPKSGVLNGDDLKTGDRVRLKESGTTATVVNANWHGLVKVKVDGAKVEDCMRSVPANALVALFAAPDITQVKIKIQGPTVSHPRIVSTVPLPPPPNRSTVNGVSQDLGSRRSTPNGTFSKAMQGKAADWVRIRHMAEHIRDPAYGLADFFEDCSVSFPELHLFFVMTPDGEESDRLGHGSEKGMGEITTSARTGEDEYQRTIGALFAVFWLFRLDNSDGRLSFCYGVDQDWRTIPLPEVFMHASTSIGAVSKSTVSVSNNSLHSKQPRRSKDLRSRRDAYETTDSKRSILCSEPEFDVSALLQRPWSQLTTEEKRLSFYGNTDWSMFSNLVTQAGCSLDAIGRVERTMAILCLTAFHDIMKVEEILPTVQPGHGPYHGYDEGVQIRDHDVALSYVLEYFPEHVPSFAGLPRAQQKAVLFTQSKMSFNHGWFVQAEAPPGAMLSRFKAALSEGTSSSDVALYFLHWLTDLAGAEATPLAGAEKFVLKFPHTVLSSFLWSIPYLEKLMGMDETTVVEAYLQARWKLVAPNVPVPDDRTAVACMRLVVMAQGDLDVVNAYKILPEPDQMFMAREMSRTGCIGQSFGRASAASRGPAVLVYYGPALLQNNVGNFDNLCVAVRMLCEVYRGARVLWPASREEQGDTVTIQVGKLKAIDVQSVIIQETRRVWVMIRHNDMEATVEELKAAQVNDLMNSQAKIAILDFARDEDDVAQCQSGYDLDEAMEKAETERALVSVKSC